MFEKTKFLPGFVLMIAFLLLTSCRSEFEKVRISGDPEQILQTGMEYYDNEDYSRAKTLFELVLNTYRGRSQAEELYFKYAYTHYYLGEHILASYYFENFSNTFPNSSFREEAEFNAAYSNYLLSPSFRLDQEYTNKAIDLFQRFVNRFPNSPRVAECNALMDELRRKLEQKAFYQADLYFRMGAYQSALVSFQHLLQDYPETSDAEKVRFLIVKSSFLLAENSIASLQEERYDDTIKAYHNFERRHSSSSRMDELNEFYQISQEKINQLSDE